MKTAKRALSLILSLMLVLGTVVVGGVSAAADATVVWDGVTNTLTVTGEGSVTPAIFEGEYLPIKGLVKVVIIGISITSIDDNTFKNCTNLESVFLSDSLTAIGDYAFYNCGNLSNICIPSGVTVIGSNAFCGCISLYEVVFEESSQLMAIGDSAFSNCIPLKKMDIPSSVTEIGSRAFSGCSSLEEVFIPSSVTEIGSRAFSNCSSLSDVILPPNITSVGQGSFSECFSLEAVFTCESLDLSDAGIPDSANIWRYEVLQTSAESPDGRTYVKITGREPEHGGDAVLYCDAMGEDFHIESVEIEGAVLYHAGSCPKSLVEITSYSDLKSFADRVNSGETSLNAKLMNDIECKNDDGTAAKDWTPIGYYKSDTDNNPFIGTFDGDGHVITGLTTPEDFDGYAGLFGCVGSNGIVRNVGLEGGSITGGVFAGGVVGWNSNNGTVQNCYNTGSVNGTAEDAQTGGIAGANNGTIKNSYFTGTVSSSKLAGGIAGGNGNGNIIQHCYNTGSVTGANEAGGLTGSNYGTVRDCYNTGSVTATEDDSCAGGTAGENVGLLINCYNTGSITDGYYKGGITGNNPEGTVQNCFYDSSVLAGMPAVNNPESYDGALSTAEMTGEDALEYMTFSYEEGETSPWLVKTNGNGWAYYPHLKGFDYETNPTDGNWPPKTEWNESDGFIYTTSGETATIIGYTGNSGFIRIPYKLDGIPVAAVKNGAFSGNTMTRVEIYYDIGSIGASSFAGCESLEEFRFCGNVETVGNSAFDGCSSLAKVTFYNNAGSIGDNAFRGCALEYVTVPAGTESIGSGAFADCASLTDAFVSENTTFGPDTFPDFAIVWRYKVVTTAAESPDGKTHVAITGRENDYNAQSVFLACDAMGPNYVIDYIDEGVPGVTLTHTADCPDNGEIIEISTYAQLKDFAALVNGTGSYEGRANPAAAAVLVNNIVADDSEWVAIGTPASPYTGSFDGQGYTVTGLSDASAQEAPAYSGLFGYIGRYGEVLNTGVVGADFNAAEFAGGVAAYNYHGLIENCCSKNAARISGGNCAGGVVAINHGIVRFCFASGGSSITGYYFAGGIAGLNNENGMIANCHCSGGFDISAVYGAGGVTGKNYGELYNCYYYGSGDLSAEHENSAGGVAGLNTGTAENCFFCGADIAAGNDEEGIESGTALAVAEFTDEGSFASFDFNNIWAAGGERPLLPAERGEDSSVLYKCGENVYYCYTDDGRILNIYGHGPMYDYEDGASPFYGNNAFDYVVIGSGVTTIGAYVFSGHDDLNIIFSKNIAQIKEGAFKDSFVHIFEFVGTPDDWEAVEIDAEGNNCLLGENFAPDFYGKYSVVPTYDVSISGTTCGETLNLTFTWPVELRPYYTCIITAEINGITSPVSIAMYEDDYAGTYTFTYPQTGEDEVLPPGEYVLVVAYTSITEAGDYASRLSDTDRGYRYYFEITDPSSESYIDVEDISHGEIEEASVYLPPVTSGRVSFLLDGQSYGTVSVTDGVAAFSIPSLNAGEYTLTAEYAGDGRNDPVTFKGDFAVSKGEPDITVTAENEGRGENTVFTVTSNAEGSVNVTVNGQTTENIPLESDETYEGGSGEGGSGEGEPVAQEPVFIATIVVPGLDSGTYPYTVHYSGNVNYIEKDIEGNITVPCDHENGYPEYVIEAIIKEVTDTEDGKVKTVCPACSDEKNETISALGDGWADKVQSTVAVDGEELKCIVQDPYRALPDGTTLVIRHIEPGERYDEISAKLDDTYTVEKVEFFEIELLDSQGDRLPMPLNFKVRVLLQIPDGMDEDEIQVVLVNAGSDGGFEETLVYKVFDASGSFIKTVDKDYEPADGETMLIFAGFWSDHFSDYALIDVFSDAEALEKSKEDAKTELENYKDADDYRPEQQAELENAVNDGIQAIENAEDADGVAAALADAKAVIDEIKTDADLTAEELEADKAAFDEYKEEKKTEIDALAQEGDSDEVKSILEDAKNEIDAKEYNENQSLEENEAALDAIVENAGTASEEQRATERLEADKAAFDEYKEEKKAEIDALVQEGDSDEVKEIIDSAKDDIDALGYDEEKSLEENKAAADAIVDEAENAVEEQREAEKTDAKVEIRDFKEQSEIGYKEDVTYTAYASGLPEGAEIHWFVNGEDVATGESYTVEDPTDDYTVQAKAIDKNGNVLDESSVAKVKVRNGFFDRLKAFFAELIEKILGKAIADLLSSVC